MSPERINHIEKNMGAKLRDLGHRKDFMNWTPKAKDVKAKINEWDNIKPKSFCIAQHKKLPTEQKINLQNGR